MNNQNINNCLQNENSGAVLLGANLMFFILGQLQFNLIVTDRIVTRNF